ACGEANRSSIRRAGGTAPVAAASPGAPAVASMARGVSGSTVAVAGRTGDVVGPGPPVTSAPVARRCPHSLQNLLTAAFELPQEGQTSPKRVPHSAQNLAASGLSWPHREQRTVLVRERGRARGSAGTFPAFASP